MPPLQRRCEDSDLYSFELVLAAADKAITMSTPHDANLWHRRMGHLNSQSLQTLNSTADNGMEYNGAFPPCDICSAEKSKQRNHPKRADNGVHAPITLLFTDIIGLISPSTTGGHNYVSKFADEFTNWDLFPVCGSV